MPLDPQVKTLIDQVVAAGLPPLNTQSVDEARLTTKALADMAGAPPPVARAEDRTVPGPAGPIPVRVYAPDHAGRLPVLVYFHGGGWVLGEIDTYDALCRTLANAARCMVVSVGYRLAPEHKFPAAPEDAYTATCWVAEHAGDLGADPSRVAIGGDSAGGNLTAVVALMARDRGGPRLVYQLLVYPVTDGACDTVSYRENADGYFLTRDSMLWFWNHYVRTEADRRNPYASPMQATDVSGLPPALVMTAEFDPLRDEGEAYAERLRKAGIAVRLQRYDGMIHGFFGMGALIDRGRVAVQDAADALRTAFGNP